MVNGNNNDHDHREGSRGADKVNEARTSSELNNADSIPQMYASFVPFMRRIVSASVRESLSLFTSIKGIVLIILVAQSCIGLLLTRYTRARPVVPEAGDPPLFSVPSAVMCTEAIKLFVCFWWVFCTELPTNNTSSATSGKHSNTSTSNGSVVGGSEGGCGGTRRDRGVSPTGPPNSESATDAHTPKNNSNGSSLSRLAHILTSPRRLYAQSVFVLRSALLHRDAWHMLPPALLFTFQSNIIYVALQNVEVTLFQVLYQSKLLLTALFVGYAFKRSFNRMQWISLFCLFIGVVVSQLGSAGNSSGKGGSPSKLQTNRGGGGRSGGGSHTKQKKQNYASLVYSGISEISMTAADENSRSLEQTHPTLGINNQEDTAVPIKEGQQAVSIVESAYIPAAAAAVEEPKEEGPAAVVSKDCADSGDVCVGKSANAQKEEQPKGGEHQDGGKDHSVLVSNDEKRRARSHQAASFPVEFSSGRKLLSLGDENKENEKVEPDALLANKNDEQKVAPTREDEKIELPSSTTEASESPPAQQKTTKKGSRKRKEATASAASTSGSSSLFGIVALLASSVSSAIAAVVMEKVLKDASSPQSLAVRNVQLAIFSLGLTGIVYYYNTLSKVAGMSTAALTLPREGPGGLTASSYLSSSTTWDRPYPPPLLYDAFGEFFLGFDAYVWALVVNQAVGGILVALVLKYADNILKGFAVAVCIFICGLFSWLVWDTHLAPGFVLGATIVTFSVVTYSVASSKGA